MKLMKEKNLVSLKTQIIGGHGTQMKKIKKKETRSTKKNTDFTNISKMLKFMNG